MALILLTYMILYVYKFLIYLIMSGMSMFWDTKKMNTLQKCVLKTLKLYRDIFYNIKPWRHTTTLT